MGSGVVDEQEISHLDLWQHPVHRKLIVVLAEGAGHIILMVAGGVLLSHDRNMVVSAVHGRAHQVHRTGVHADIFLIGMLFVDGPGH